MRNERLVSFLLRTGIAIAFLYAAIAAFLDPFSWVGFLPAWIESMTLKKALLALFSGFEIILAFMLLSGKQAFHVAAFSSATLFLIIIVNVASLDILFRDVPILFAALALMVLEKKTNDI